MGNLYSLDRPFRIKPSACLTSGVVGVFIGNWPHFTWPAHLSEDVLLGWLSLIGKRKTSIYSDPPWNDIHKDHLCT